MPSKTATIALTFSVALGSSAHAESQSDPGLTSLEPAPSRFYVGGAPGISTVGIGVQVDVGYRFSELPLFAHALASIGPKFYFPAHHQVRAGLEARVTRSVFHLFGGMDVGYQALSEAYAGEGVEHHPAISGFVVAPRAGIELGTGVRGRLSGELPIYKYRTYMMTSAETTVGVGVFAGLVVAL